MTSATCGELSELQMLRNQRQATIFPVQSVPEIRLLVFDFAVYAPPQDTLY